VPDAATLTEQGGGVVLVNICVDTTGRLMGEPTVISSSGSQSLDDAAIHILKSGSGKFTPATIDGKPIQCCVTMKYRFQVVDHAK
jgi:TonB family protein